MSGASWLHYVDGNTKNFHNQDFVTHSELFGRRALKKWSWTAVFIPKPLGPYLWHLFNVPEELGETTNLMQEDPQKPEEMIERHQDYARKNGVVP